jgi:hypothetical protein
MIMNMIMIMIMIIIGIIVIKGNWKQSRDKGRTDGRRAQLRERLHTSAFKAADLARRVSATALDPDRGGGEEEGESGVRVGCIPSIKFQSSGIGVCV